MVKQVLLCGCGNIGFRHLQALTAVNTPIHVTIVEPNVAGHTRIKDYIASPDAGPRARYNLRSDLPQDRQQFDLVVIATNAKHRRAAFEAIMDAHDVGCIIFEKVLFQTLEDLDKVQEALNANALPAFVNCGRRGFDSYRSLAAEFSSDIPTDITVTGGAFGLASNAIHFLDLAEMLNGQPITTLDLSGLDSVTFESKRGGFVEIFGTITAQLANGANLMVTCADTPNMNITIGLRHADTQISIDELGSTLTRNGTPEPFTLMYVSGMPYLYDDALAANDPKLTPFTDSARQHRFYLTEMLEHLGLPVSDDTPCPIS